MNQCTECGSKDDYNFSLNIGLCNSCIGAKLDSYRWIPVDERLPENVNDILLLYPCGTILMGWYNGSWCLYTEPYFATNCLTHWRPIILPEKA